MSSRDLDTWAKSKHKGFASITFDMGCQLGVIVCHGDDRTMVRHSIAALKQDHRGWRAPVAASLWKLRRLSRRQFRGEE